MPQKKFLQNHLTSAHHIWKGLVQVGDYVIDATCGNGHDTCFLRGLVGESGFVFGFDIQEQALQNTRQRLLGSFEESYLKNVHLINGSHANFTSEIIARPFKLIVYNLGYLPGGDKSLVTQAQNTLQSLQVASQMILEEGMISVTCYSGHAQGYVEEQKILDWASMLDPCHWICCHHRWINRKKAASLLLITKKTKEEEN